MVQSQAAASGRSQQGALGTPAAGTGCRDRIRDQAARSPRTCSAPDCWSARRRGVRLQSWQAGCRGQWRSGRRLGA
jgi:hypothetical protein